MMTIPNLLTIVRILLTPFFVWFFIEGRMEAALLLFLVGAVTDALDGLIARRFHQISRLGKMLDPAADKFFLVSSYTAAYLLGMIPLWLLTAAILKDAVLLSGMAILHVRKRRIAISPTLAGKSSTAFQIFTILFLIFNRLALIPDLLLLIMMILTAILLFYSMVSYVMIGFKIDAGKITPDGQ